MRRRHNGRYILLFLSFWLVFGALGFMFGYYMVPRNMAYDPQGEDIPGQLNSNRVIEEESPLASEEDPIEEDQVVTSPEILVGENTEIVYRTHFTQCQSIRDEKSEPMEGMLGLNEQDFKQLVSSELEPWQVVRFSGEQVILFVSKDQICPNHFWVSEQDGYIAIYQFDESGERHMVEKTSIPIAPLPKLDQDKIQAGILLKSMNEVNQLLEDYSS